MAVVAVPGGGSLAVRERLRRARGVPRGCRASITLVKVPDPRHTERRETEPTIHLLCGLVAAGKTTLAEQLAPALPAVRLSRDEWMIRPPGLPSEGGLERAPRPPTAHAPPAR